MEVIAKQDELMHEDGRGQELSRSANATHNSEAAKLSPTPSQTHVAVCMTCFNRKDVTLRCLRRLSEMILPLECRLSLHLVDDNSPDQTASAVRTEFPNAHLYAGTGKLYWGGGMRMAFAEAMKSGPDFFLWLNDDVELDTDAIIRILATYRKVSVADAGPAIVAGATRDPTTGRLSYSGWRRKGRSPFRLSQIQPAEVEPIACDTMNGNVVLIPAEVANRVGNIDPRFTHQAGDLDYGLRAGRQGVQIWICPGFVGTCRLNVRTYAWQDPRHTLCQRVKALISPRDLPIQEFIRFAYRHGGLWGAVAALAGYRRVIFPKKLE